MLCVIANIYVFYGKETDSSKPYYNKDPVSVLAFRSAEGGFYFICARDDNNVALQVGVVESVSCSAFYPQHNNISK